MFEIPIYIPIETKVREYHGKLLLIAHLFKSGFQEYYFGSRTGILQETLYNNPGIVILKSIEYEQEEYYSLLKKRGFIIILIHAEGGIYYRDDYKSIISCYPNNLLKFIDLNFVFGEKIRKTIQSYNNDFANNNTYITGEPRFDLLKDKYNIYFDDFADKMIKKYGKYILINTNFSAGNSIVGKDNSINYIMNNLTITNSFKLVFIRRMDLTAKLVQDYIEAIKYLAINIPEISLIVRPHPSESEIIYNESFSNIRNIYVIKEGNVAGWIHGAIGVIHYDCTTGMEAVLSGKPVISYLPRVDDELLTWLPVKLSKIVTEKDTLLHEITSILNNEFYYQISDDTIKIWKSYVHNIDIDAAPIISDVIKSKCAEAPLILSRNLKKLAIYRIIAYIKKIKKELKVIYYKFLRCFSKSIRTEFLKKEGTYRIKEVDHDLSKLLDLIGFKCKYRLSKVSPGVVRIKRF